MTLFSSTDRYLARLILLPLVGSLVIAAMLLVLDRMLRLFDFVASEGGPVSVVWRMLANLLPEYLSLGIPIGLLLGILLAFRRLAMSSELDVLQAVGQGYNRMLFVPYLYTIALAAVNLGIVGYVQPVARFAYEELRFELRSGALGASIKVGEFNRLGKDMTLRIDKSADEGRNLSGIFVMARQGGGKSLSVAAERGQFLATDDKDVIILRLSNGTLVHDQPGFRAPRVLTFTAHDLPIDLPKMEAFRKRGEKETEMTLPQLVETGGNTAIPVALRNEARSNFHYRIAEVMMMFLLPLLAIALAVPPKRSTSALGVFVSIVMVVTYHKINEYAQGLGGALGVVDPFVALWVPFALFAGLILWMYYTIAFVPGGQPIGALDRVAGKAIKAVRNLFAKKN
ncbi:LPS export ABC transporter permease LptF [Sphingomonas sp. SUN039]|uniref:LPS export ABC transporter permease LptF n=1 Tax=Sphingomonas sp. SUN039 TaxID=2937787 RepID=UPI00216457E5|nr:LPS export ABC transporter permease LptF [Sphingomonas sp. SUN039]UVO54433.1 LPS export ABC transporter permease LptF [Sphingomonas sp. SUN039]